MIAPELSYYPSDEDELLRQQLEHARRRDIAADDLGRLATLMTTGGIIEMAHGQPLPHAQEKETPTSRTIPRLGATALMSEISHSPLLTTPLDATADALRYQEITAARFAARQYAA